MNKDLAVTFYYLFFIYLDPLTRHLLSVKTCVVQHYYVLTNTARVQ